MHPEPLHIPDPFQLPRHTLSDTVDTASDGLLAQLTLEEKLGFCRANSIFTVAGVERLGIPEWVMSDGPHGVRMEMKRHDFVPRGDCDDATTYLPVGIALGATWSVDCAAAFGDVLGAEARARGKDVILGPGVNLIRTPLCGRNFEYLGEDPLHAGALAVELTRAIQAHDVAACVKHYALNNQELNRHGVNVEVEERVLRELYLTAFELVVTRGGCLTVMGAYNRFRGQHCCHHAYLLQGILKSEWGFPYAVISDWGGVHDADEAARNGLDVEMGGKLDALYLDRPFREGLARGNYPESLLDDKARRVLRVQAATRLGEAQRASGERLTPRHQEIARRIAEECLVLLKNEGDLLPLDARRLRRIAVIGDNADRVHASGGGSSGIRAVYETTPLDGLRAFLGEDVLIDHVRGYPVDAAGIRPIPVDCLGVADHAGIRGWHMEVFDNRSEKGEPSMTAVASVPEMEEGVCPMSGTGLGNWMAKWTATVTPALSGTYRLACKGGDYFELKVGDTVVSSVWDLTEAVCTTEAVDWQAGQAYELTLRYRPKMNAQGFRFGWITPDADRTVATDPFAAAEAAARRADVVLCFAGSSHFQDSEGADRRDMSLLGGQNELIERLAAANPRLVVVLFGGSAVEMPWLAQVPVLIQAWYPGQEGGHAIARVLFGEVNPSGRLPFSWPKRLHDVAAHAHESYHADHADYREGMNHGYRWHNGAGPDALFPFGHGLGYTTFAYRDLACDASDPALLRVSLTLANTGKRKGAEVVQVYLAPGDEAAELKGFAKVELPPGGETRLDFTFGSECRRRWDTRAHAWTSWTGPLRVGIGASATDIRLRGGLAV